MAGAQVATLRASVWHKHFENISFKHFMLRKQLSTTYYNYVFDKRKPSHIPGDQAANTRIEAKHLFEKHYFGNLTLQISL